MKSAGISLLLIGLFACKGRENTKTHFPSPIYRYAIVDTAMLADKHSVYVPVYSHIYTEGGTAIMNLNATLSVRNTSLRDSFYLTAVTYYGSKGEVLKQYLDSTIVMHPMTSVEFVVERTESIGGAGANFVVRWGARETGITPLVQAVMIEGARGISFATDGIEMR